MEQLPENNSSVDIPQLINGTSIKKAWDFLKRKPYLKPETLQRAMQAIEKIPPEGNFAGNKFWNGRQRVAYEALRIMKSGEKKS